MKTLTTLLFSVMSSVILAQIPNACFDTWSGGNPTGWYTGNSLFPGTTTQSSTVHGSCTSAVSLNSLSGLGGFIETNNASDPYFSNPGNPVALNGWYQLTSNGYDDIKVIVETKCASGTANGGVTDSIYAATTVYKQFSVCITYGNPCTADSAFILIELTNPGGGTHNGSFALIDDLSFGACTSGVDEVKNDVVLEPAYPNPANDLCNIIYSLPNSGTVNVALYDISGRKVTELLNNTKQTPGKYKIPVDVRNLANGVYIYTITVDGVPYSQKLTVVK